MKVSVSVLLVITVLGIISYGCLGLNQFQKRELVSSADVSAYDRTNDSFWFGLDGLKEQGVKVEVDQNGGPEIAIETQVLQLTGCTHSFGQASYPNVVALSWVFSLADDKCVLKTNDGAGDVITSEIKSLFSHFPNVHRLCVEVEGVRSRMVVLRLDSMENVPPLKFLEIHGRGLIVTGLWKSLQRMKSLKTLTIEGPCWWLPDSFDELAGAMVVPTLAGAVELEIETLNLRGCLLLEQDSLEYVTGLKKLTPPIYYCLKNIPSSVEILDMTQSEPPLDGYGQLASLSQLRKVIIFPKDEQSVRAALRERRVEILLVQSDHDGRRH